MGSLEQFVSPILIQSVLDLKKGQSRHDKKLDLIIAHLKSRAVAAQPLSPHPAGRPALRIAHTIYAEYAFHRAKGRHGQAGGTLLSDGAFSVVVNQTITGMGGIGKTQLAVEFAYEYGYKFEGVHWLDLHEAGTLDTQIALCGSKIGLPLWPPTLPEQVTATMREWLQNSPRLLILDNFEEIESANEVLARLRHSGLRLLITSRRTDWNTALG